MDVEAAHDTYREIALAPEGWFSHHPCVCHGLPGAALRYAEWNPVRAGFVVKDLSTVSLLGRCQRCRGVEEAINASGIGIVRAVGYWLYRFL